MDNPSPTPPLVSPSESPVSSINSQVASVVTKNLQTTIPVVKQSVVQSNIRLTSLFIRFGLIFVFGWAAVIMSLNPASYLHYMPMWVESFMPRTLALHIFSIYEIVLCLWLLSGKKMMYAGILSAVTIAGLTGVNYKEFGVLFRNVSIFFSAVALSVLSNE